MKLTIKINAFDNACDSLFQRAFCAWLLSILTLYDKSQNQHLLAFIGFLLPLIAAGAQRNQEYSYQARHTNQTHKSSTSSGYFI